MDPDSPATSATLLDRLRRAGDAAAWERFARLYAPLLHAWAVKRGFQDADAADLTQEVLLKLVRELPGYARGPGQTFRGWLYRVTANQCRDFRRRVATRPLPAAAGLTDLGADPAAEPDELTTTGAILGTVHDMSPEQAEGRAVDARTDLFSLGAVLYHAATGQRPFTGDTQMAVMWSVRFDTPPPPRTLSPTLPPHLAGLIDRLLAKSPDDRPPSAAAVAAALDAPEPARRRPRRRVAVALGLVAAAAAAAAFAADVIVVRDKAGKEVARVPVPDGGRAEKEDGKGNVTPLVVPPPPAPAPGRSPLDALDPARIPAAERFPWQPKELVAVIGEHRQRHWKPVRSLTISPDGKRAAAFAPAHPLYSTVVWDVPGRRELHQQPAAIGIPVGFAPDGKLVTQQAVWDISGAERREVVTFPESIGLRVAFSLDGRTAVSWGGTVRLWDAGADRWTLRHAFPDAAEAAVSPSGGTLAVVAAKTGRVALYSLAERVPLLAGDVPLPALAQGPSAVGTVAAFVADDRLVTTDGNTLRLWTLGGPRPVAAAEARSVGSVLGGTAAAGRFNCYARAGGVEVWDTAGDRLTIAASTNTADRNDAFLHGAQLTPDGTNLVTIHLNGSIRFWGVAGKAVTERQPLALQPIWSRFSIAGRYLLSQTEDGARGGMWDLGGPAPVPVADPDRLFSSTGWCEDGGFSPDGERFFVCGRYKWPILGRVRDGKVARTHEFPHDASAGALSRDGRRFAAVGEGHLFVYDVAADPPRLIGRAPYTHSQNTLNFTRPDGSRLIAHGTDLKTDPREERLVTFAAENGAVREVSRVTIPPAFRRDPNRGQLSFSPDGTTLVITSHNSNGGLCVYDVPGDTPRLRAEGRFGTGQYVGGVGVLSDNRTAAVTSSGRVALHDLETRRVVRSWDLPNTPNQVAVSADGRHLVTGNPNGTIYVLRLDAPR